MKIEKLYTLSQFVDLMAQKHYDEFVGAVISYNVFLKKKLVNEMFVNPYQKPDESKYKMEASNYLYIEHLNKWQEAEKKVIFINPPYTFEEYEHWACSDLHDLANMTNGELEINLEL